MTKTEAERQINMTERALFKHICEAPPSLCALMTFLTHGDIAPMEAAFPEELFRDWMIAVAARAEFPELNRRCFCATCALKKLLLTEPSWAAALSRLEPGPPSAA